MISGLAGAWPASFRLPADHAPAGRQLPCATGPPSLTNHSGTAGSGALTFPITGFCGHLWVALYQEMVSVQ
jgi:hypothetical protein